MKKLMNSIGIVFIIAIFGGLLLFMIFLRKEDETIDFSYVDRYFINQSLITGDHLIKSIEKFHDIKLELRVKTKLSNEFVSYNWDSDRKQKIKSYNLELATIEATYINKTALFYVEIIGTEKEIAYIYFEQK